MKTIRVLITGTRALKDRTPVWNKLDDIELSLDPGDTLILTHGAASGVDLSGEEWTFNEHPSGVIVINDPHPAKWEDPCVPSCWHGPRKIRADGTDYCQAAGMRRNAEMVNLIPDHAVAFPRVGPKNLSKGTYGCIKLIEAKKIIPFEIIPVEI